jgi:NADH-quinone oxidoreductase subunit L
MDYTFWDIAPIYLFPVLAFVFNAFFSRKIKIGPWIATAAIFASFLWTCRIFADVMATYSTDFYVHKVFTWIDLSAINSTFKIELGVYLDNMAVIMMMMVTGVATIIHIFSTWYMKGDIRENRFFVFLPLFTSAMIGLVLANNLLLMFMFWEIMGFCSYSLIGIYYEKEEAGDASLKAFMTTRVGDVFFLLGILAIWAIVGNVNFPDIYAAIAEGKFSAYGNILGMSAALFAGLCIFMGNVGKSAQFPLQVWLPDAMMGPTPGSALIHAATMVAAGVYLSLRVFPLYDVAGLLPLIAMIGGITAFGAATIALVQTDIKAVLAYSTISQLGYMVLGIGVGSYNAAFMHIITHAVFKACLFMSAGSVIHAIHEQQMPKMGGLRKKLPFTFIAMMFCTLAISGIPFFTGFVSKDRILGDALYYGFFAEQAWYAGIPAVLGFIGAFLTPFYMFRMMFLTFFGEPRDKEIYDHAHKEKLKFNHNVPLLVLSIFTLGVVFSGSLTGQGIAKIFPEAKQEWFKTLVEAPVISKFKSHTKEQFSFTGTTPNKNFEHAHYDSHHVTGYAGPNQNPDKLHHVHQYAAIASIIIAFSGLFLAFFMYIKKSVNPATFVNMFSGWYRALNNKYYFDHVYIEIFIKKILLGFNKTLAFIDMGIYDRVVIDGWQYVNRVIYKAANWFDHVIIDSVAVDGTGTSVNIFNLLLRIVQSGKIQFYFVMLIIAVSGYIFSFALN